MSTILDAYTKQILSYVLSDSLEVDFVLQTVNQMIAQHGVSLTTETILHSDQGCHYTSCSFIQLVKDKGLRQSMSRRGNCWDEITPYLVFMNSHDGTGAIKAAMTPVRVVCQNTLNLALSTAKRSWSTNHVGDIRGKLEDAKYTLLYAQLYMSELGRTIDQLNRQKISDRQVYEYIDALFPLVAGASDQQKKNLMRMKEDLKARYFEAPDLQHVGKNAYRFVNAVSDFATHAKPIRERSNYRESLFGRTVDGNAMIDRAYAMVKAA